MSDESNSQEESKPITLSAEQFSQMMGTIQELTQKVDTLQHELESQKASGSPEDLLGISEKQEVVSLTKARIENLRAIADDSKRRRAEPYVELASKAAIEDFKQNPPKHRR
ncbi:unnamed protein product [marine sediment metagenome]|uniref:Uncharacterized protein n=2 Tax=marine sediment metagenome TaxID=412755 RepID=X1PA73_9ZZZZ